MKQPAGKGGCHNTSRVVSLRNQTINLPGVFGLVVKLVDRYACDSLFSCTVYSWISYVAPGEMPWRLLNWISYADPEERSGRLLLFWDARLKYMLWFFSVGWETGIKFSLKLENPPRMGATQLTKAFSPLWITISRFVGGSGAIVTLAVQVNQLDMEEFEK